MFIVLLLIWGYFKEGTIILAAKSFHKKDYEKTESLLSQITHPAWLSKKRRGFYEFMMGGVALQKQDYLAAEIHYELASKYPLRTVNDHVAALVHVANINVRQGNYDKAEAYIQQAKREPAKHHRQNEGRDREAGKRIKTHISKRVRVQSGIKDLLDTYIYL